MASVAQLKQQLDQHYEPKKSMDTFTGQESPFLRDTVSQLMPLFNKVFSSGGVKGETLVALCFGPFFQWALPSCDHFKDVFICLPNDKCIEELEKWRTNAPEAIDWTHATKELCELQGKGESWHERQKMWQKKIKEPLKYDVINCNPLSPTVLPQADCLLLSHCIESHVTDKKGFCAALKNVSTLLKPGGDLLLIACLEATFYMSGTFKFPHLSIDECFVRKALGEACYDIKELHELPRTVYHLQDVADYSAIIFVHALKK
ncbi:indolethylamine N-methyltransferase-like [Lissotriton helveticus]